MFGINKLEEKLEKHIKNVESLDKLNDRVHLSIMNDITEKRISQNKTNEEFLRLLNKFQANNHCIIEQIFNLIMLQDEQIKLIEFELFERDKHKCCKTDKSKPTTTPKPKLNTVKKVNNKSKK